MEDKNFDINDLDVNKLERLDDESKESIVEAQLLLKEDPNYAGRDYEKYMIGGRLLEADYNEEAIKCWNSISRENEEVYAVSQYYIGYALYSRGENKEAIKALSRIKFEDSINTYLSSKAFSVRILLREGSEESIVKAKNIITEVKLDNYFDIHILKKVCFFLSNGKAIDMANDLIDIITNIHLALHVLCVKKLDGYNNEKFHERKLAHYTSTEVSEFVLKDKNRSLFRLNTIKNVNDPSEGQLLQKIIGKWSLKEENHSYEDDYHAFIGCFTFNHDSLNQFRLYGKKDNKEASGVSFVFNDTFFNTEPRIENTILISSKIEDNEDIGGIPQQPVMRCVYIDPETRYISLAQRNKITFYREYLEGDNHNERAEDAWKVYQEDIDKKTEEFCDSFENVKRNYKSICNKSIGLSKNLKEELQELLDEILLPLKYLIKHAAFQEEQECRIIYITSLDDSKVKMDFGKSLYVEYEPNVKAHLDKIYIAPAASHYQPYLAKLLCGTNNLGKKIKIELSNNPFRLPTSH